MPQRTATADAPARCDFSTPKPTLFGVVELMPSFDHSMVIEPLGGDVFATALLSLRPDLTQGDQGRTETLFFYMLLQSPKSI